MARQVYVLGNQLSADMTEEIDAVLFDAGGTLIEMRPPRERVISDVLAQLGFEIGPDAIARALAKADGVFDEDMAMLDGKDETRFWVKYDQYILKELGFKGDAKEFSTLAGRAFDDIVPKTESWVDYPDVRPVLDLLSKRDIALGVVSNATDLAVKVLDNLDLTKYFGAVVWSEDVGVRKPAPKIFHLAANRLGVSPSRCIFAGDKFAVDVVGAKRAGMNAVLIDRLGAYPDANCIKGTDLNVFRRFL